MNEQQAIDLVKAHINERGYTNYPTDNLEAERFEIGWTVFNANDPTDIKSLRVGQTIFHIGDNGHIEESSSSFPPGQAEKAFVDKFKAR